MGDRFAALHRKLDSAASAHSLYMASHDEVLTSRLALTSLAAKVEHKLVLDAFNADDGRSSLTHLSKGQDHLNEYHDQSVFKLHLATWINMSRISSTASDAVNKERFRHILHYFIEKAVRNNLGEHPATKILEKCHQKAMFKGPLEVVDMRHRIQKQEKPTLVSTSPEQKYRDWTFKNYPLHDFWDALALIYTISVGEVFDDREGELYLLQLKFIVRALNATGYIGRAGIPVTVGASWHVSEETPLRVSFAFSCVGGKQEMIREKENESRRRYCEFLYSVRKVIKLTSSENPSSGNTPKRSGAPNGSGNCPEFVNWATVCQEAGIYKTLCLNIRKDETMKCCTHCEERSH